MKRLSRILPILFVITSVLGGIHFFIYSVAVNGLAEDDPLRLYIALLFTIGVLLMPGGLIITMSPWRKPLFPLTMAGYLWMGTFPILWFFSLVEFVSQFVYSHSHSLWILSATLSIAIWAVFGGLRPPRIREHQVRAPSFMHGLTLVQISDLHIGMYFLKGEWLAKVSARIQALNADLLAITGDLTDGLFDEVSPMLAPLEAITPKLGKFYITGNHEYIREGAWEHRLSDLGFRVLHNTNEVIERQGQKLMIAGVPDLSVPRFRKELNSNPDLALKDSGRADYRILLAHQPRSILQIRKERCDLALTGHTHAGQIFPFRIFVRLQQPMVSGFKKINNILTFAHQGTGHWGPPMRWFTRSEIVVFKFV